MKVLPAAVMVIAFALHAHADEVYLTDGSKLVGTVQRMDDKELVMTTGFAPELKIKPELVAGVTSDRELAVTLSNGERVVGVPVYTAEGGQKVTGTETGDVAVTDNRIATIKDENAPVPPPPGPAWTARVEFGLTGSTGNTERNAFRGRAEANRKTDRDRLLLFLEGNYAEQSGERSQNEVFGGAKYEIDLDQKWFAFARQDLEYDEFENLDLRSTTTAGLGRFFIRKEDHELKARGGVGYQYEMFDDGTREDDVILELGYDYRVDLHKYFRFTHSLTYFPALEDPLHDYRVRAETAGEVPLGSVQNWKLRAGMRNDYDGNPQPGVENLDTTYFLNLVYDFK